MPSLWPDDIAAVDATVQPVQVLREQADLLGQITRGRVTGVVRTYPSGESFIHAFYLACPELDDYTFKLFDVNHRLDGYPVTIVTPNNPRLDPQSFDETHCRNQVEFETRLKDVLSSGRTKQIVKALLVQVQDRFKR